GKYDLVILEHSGDKQVPLGSASVDPMPTPDGFHRLTMRVHGKTLRAQLDTAPPVEAKTSIVPRGRWGVTVGIFNQASAPITLRSLQIARWPPFTEEEQRVQLETATQRRVAQALDSAALRLSRKEMESASLTLREALRDLDGLP